MSTTSREAERAYKICIYEFERLNPDADIYRERFLERRSKEEIERGNIKKTKEIKSLIDRKIARKTWGSIGRALQN